MTGPDRTEETIFTWGAPPLKFGAGASDEVDYVVLSHLSLRPRRQRADVRGHEREAVTLIETPGHTVGCMSMQVELPETGTMVFTSDAVYMGDSYGPPATPAAIVNNLEQWYSSVEKLRGIQECTGAQMVFGHDAERIHQLRTAPTGSYS